MQLLEATAESGVNPKLRRAAGKAVEHLMNLVEAVIAFSDASTGELRLNENRCELGDLLAEIAYLHLSGADGVLFKACRPASKVLKSPKFYHLYRISDGMFGTDKRVRRWRPVRPCLGLECTFARPRLVPDAKRHFLLFLAPWS